MHEYSVASAIVDQVKQVMLEHNATRVKKIQLVISPYELIVPELLLESYEIISSSTEKFQGSVLDIQVLPQEITCLACEYTGEPDSQGDAEFSYNFKSPKCGSRDTHVDIKEMIIESVDLVI